MGTKFSQILRVSCLVLGLVGLYSSAIASMFVVCDDGSCDFTSIAEAISVAQYGDSIAVHGGTYLPIVNPISTKLTIFETQGVVAIDGQLSMRCLSVAADGDLTLVGIDLINGRSASPTGDGGGGLFSEGSLTLRDLLIRDCYSEAGGGGLSVRGECTLEQVVIESCHASGSGGGLLADQCVLDASSVVIRGCETDKSGGGIYLLQSRALMDGIRISRCFATERGGGMSIFSSGLWAYQVLSNSVLDLNVAGQIGGGVSVMGSLVIEACTIVGNKAEVGGGIRCFFGFDDQGGFWSCAIRSVIVTECIGDGLISGGTYPIPDCCNFYGNIPSNYGGGIPDQTGTHGNISKPPLFCDLIDYELQKNSPCVNAPGCGLIGAMGIGCENTATMPTSWSHVKSLY